MKIPKTFKLLGQTITVVTDSQLIFNEEKVGMAAFRRNEISLAMDEGNYPRPREQEEKTFYHELVHWILYLMGSKKWLDEKFVEIFALLLHQALTTAEGELSPHGGECGDGDETG